MRFGKDGFEDPDTKTEYVMLRLRLLEGILLADYRERFGEEFCSGRQPLIKNLQNLGYIKLSDKSLSLTERGFYVSNYIISELI